MNSLSPSSDPLGVWVEETAQRALGFAITLVRNRQDAEDIVHDCYLRLLTKSGEYDLPRDGMKLLFRSITNACINWTQRRPPEQSFDQLERVSGAESRSLADGRAIDPAAAAMRNELEIAVAKALRELPVVQRAAIELRSLGHSLEEIAEMLDVSHANARVILHRARTALAEKLQHLIEEEQP